MPFARSKAMPPDNEDAVAWVKYLGGDVDRFQKRFGGQQIYIPHSVPGSHPLSETLGTEVANRLCEELSGVQCYVRTLRDTMAQTRRLLVLILTWAGFGLNRIAEIGEMSVRHACGIRGSFRRSGFLPPARKTGGSLDNERY